ncbi:lasso peptide biosynthesis PqqD family chaperone [Streptosporangium sp. LJ11]|uniref:lasso peptide biosynthesis PqqD family chaperone n=1 Tax=Streptosporangium sp. LJ11 TaxID=3436927 RepID=UPI003F79DD81
MATFSIRDGMSRVHTDYGDVLLDETTGRYFHTNPSASLVLDTFERGGDTDEAAERLAAEFNIDHSTARSDVEMLLDHLRKLGVLE